MKKKNTAAILAFFFGSFGVHRFYLKQPGLGILYIILLNFFGISAILGVLDAVLLLMMSEEEFDYKYNRSKDEKYHRRDFSRRQRKYRRIELEEKERRPEPSLRRRGRGHSERQLLNKKNPYKSSGIRKFKEFDIDGAIADFLKGLEISPEDVSLHFNIACAYSLNEKAELAFKHISRAVNLGFNDFERIRTHDALAYVRIQPQWEEFERNNYQLTMKLDAPKENLLDKNTLLEQLNKLEELKTKGLISEKEFALEKKKLEG